MNEVTTADRSAIMEQVLVKGDLSKLTPNERNDYYLAVCKSLGLNPLTKPLDYIVLSGKTVLYAKRDAADQLRKLNDVSIEITDRHITDGIILVTVRATDKQGRIDSDIGAVPLPQGAGEIKANAVMKAITKAKRRVTLSICGLGFLDESEVESIPKEERLSDEQERELHELDFPRDEPIKDDWAKALHNAAKKGLKTLEDVWLSMPREDQRRLQEQKDELKKLLEAGDKRK